MIASFHNLASAPSPSQDLVELRCKGDWFDYHCHHCYTVWYFCVTLSLTPCILSIFRHSPCPSFILRTLFLDISSYITLR